MPFHDLEKARIQATVGALVDRRQPPAHLQDQLRFEVELDGLRVRIWEVRPAYMDPTQTIRSGVAQFTLTRKTGTWTLYWMRRDGKWHRWDPDECTGTLAELVRIVDEDRSGGFWG